jgi:hypothetical protein
MASTTTTTAGQQVATPIVVPQVKITLDGDSLLLLGGLLVWVSRAFWSRFLRPQVVTHLDGVFAPIEEERQLNILVAQIGCLTRASRVVLGAFHNGTLDQSGYHYNKISAVNTYNAPGSALTREPVRDLPLGRVITEVEAMMRTPDGWLHFSADDANLPIGCRGYLERNSIHKISGLLIRVGNLPIGILSIQWDDPATAGSMDLGKPFDSVMRHTIEQLSAAMRRRVVRPPAYQRFMAKVRNPFNRN